jgi:tRNA uridine 5-carboxymethylaminomethyl modification enzyme
MKSKKNNKYDVVVIGAGHAGCEASLVCSRSGKSTLLCTMNLDTIAQLSCNPAMGGIAKGQLIREVDALGGQIGRITDKALIQFSMLNLSKGPAVQSPRAQCDKFLYRTEMKKSLEEQENLDIKQTEIIKINIKNGSIVGVTTKTGLTYETKAVIITTGTFLNGVIHIGDTTFNAGRSGEFPSIELAENLKNLGFEIKRLKTGTPVRVLKNSIDLKKLKTLFGDEKIKPFSFFTNEKLENKTLCWTTYTNEKTHEIIRKNLHRSPLYGGKIKGVGPRYCPSLEDKVVRFAHMNRHQIFFEPESLSSDELYCNGISSSLPEDVQIDFVHSISGLENAEITRIGYAIEYDYAPPTQLYPTLETKKIKGLYFAGQINGTTGYEEAAAQGYMAGINAVLKINKKDPFILKRHEAYIGVLIDDLVTKGVLDPYRMFTSRAEYRLLLRNDNIDERLLHYGHNFGLVTDKIYNEYKKYRHLLNKTKVFLEKKMNHKNISEAQLIRRDAQYYKWLEKLDDNWFDDVLDNGYWDKDLLIKNCNTEIKYHGYIEKQKKEVLRLGNMEETLIPKNIDYDKIIGLGLEARQKFKQIKPLTIGQASRISGISDSDLSVILVHMKKNRG